MGIADKHQEVDGIMHTFCFSFNTQLKHYRSHGQTRSCSSLFDDWKTCLTAKTISDVQKKKELLDTMSVNEPPHRHDVWEYKKIPSFYNNERNNTNEGE